MTAGMLHGIRIVDMTGVVFGPYATHMLADLGADVIKVEPPQGDQMRMSGRPARTRLMSPAHLTLNRGKRSIVLDLKLPQDAEVMRALLADAEIFIHNVRAEAIAKLGFGYDEVRDLNPEIIYVHGVGFGSSGPYAELQAYDDAIQAATGAVSLASRVDGDPRPRYIPSLIADKVAGLYGAQAMLAALTHKLRTGRGQLVEVPMFEAFAHFILEEHLGGHTFVPPTAPIGYPRQLDPARQPFPTADGYVSIVPYTDANLVETFRVLGRPEICEGEGFATARDRGLKISELYALIAELTPKRTTSEWVEALRAARIPAMAVRDLADVTEDPHLKAVGFFRQRTHPTEGEFLEMQPPVRYSDASPATIRTAPTLGEHSEEIRAELREAGLLT
ncbi:MAG: CoA transferase [Caulobacteraceae bacterium]|jgi:crotonobetainyl-CoA:carnitine CoA-transferase CaiB-like acyl-CoA transferase